MTKEIEDIVNEIIDFDGTKEEFQKLKQKFISVINIPNLTEADRKELAGFSEAMIHLDHYYSE